jgi:hypothetical protein
VTEDWTRDGRGSRGDLAAQSQALAADPRVPADAMAATWWRGFPQKLHGCSAPASSRTCRMVAPGVLTVRPGPAI